MEIRLTNGTVPVRTVLLDMKQEQDFSQSIVLPDYEPEIFRVISCEAAPFITDLHIAGGKLAYTLAIELRVLYCSEGSDSLCRAAQTIALSGSADLTDIPDNAVPEVRLFPEMEYQNCRAAGKRRLDVRGAAAVRIKACVQRNQSIVTGFTEDAPSGLQLRLKDVCSVRSVRNAVRNISLSESVPLTSGRPVLSVLRCTASSPLCSCSVIAGKLVVRGELTADILMKTGTPEDNAVESMRAVICPFSQIIDMDGITESFKGFADADIISFDVKPSGSDSSLSCSAEIRLNCQALESGTVSAVTDAYSTRYKCSCGKEELVISGEPQSLDQSFVLSCDIRAGGDDLHSVSDLSCRLKNVSIEPLPLQGKLRVTGMLSAAVLSSGEQGGVGLTCREEAFEELVDIRTTGDSMQLSAFAEPYECSYHLSAEGCLSVKCSVRLRGIVYPESRIRAVTDIALDTDTPAVKDRDCALRIYYGRAGESVWDIAKRAGTRAEAVMEENGLTGEYLKKSGMLLIPVVH